MRRRAFVKGLVGVSTGLVGATALPHETAAAGHGGGCQAPWGPLHNYLWDTAPDFWWQHTVIWRESNFDPGAYNPSGASGLAQFMPSTWRWGQERFGIYGSPFDPYAAIDMFNAFIAAGLYSHWSETAPW